MISRFCKNREYRIAGIPNFLFSPEFMWTNPEKFHIIP